MNNQNNGAPNPQDNKPAPLCVHKLLTQDRYIIPIYQRNYAWGASEIRQLIQDVYDYSQNPEPKDDYYIGSLVVYQREDDLYEIIDGQQRFTTLIILISAIKNNKDRIFRVPWDEDKFASNLTFETRDESTETLRALCEALSPSSNLNAEIDEAYRSIDDFLRAVVTESETGGSANGEAAKEKIEQFCKYLWEQVVVLRITVPPDTNLNHYFEIMNNRGEQLEQHEIIKARCLEKIGAEHEQERRIFAKIWDSCANMSTYIQDRFPDGFDAESDIKVSQEAVYESTKSLSESIAGALTLQNILGDYKDDKLSNAPSESDPPEKFTTVIDFPNFLLQVLRLHAQENVPLDDKRLLDSFDTYLLKDDSRERVLEFGYNLLKCKFLFDQYIVKRETTTGDDAWVLKRYKKDKDNKSSYVSTFGEDATNGEAPNDFNQQICMLLSMFHVSFSSQTNKHWLSGALKYLFDTYNKDNKDAPISAGDYLDYLKQLAHAFLRDRFLTTNQVPYYDITNRSHKEGQIAQNGIETSSSEEVAQKKARLHEGTMVPHYIFNYLDYLLWQKYRTDSTSTEGERLAASKFRFTIRNSVEHWYPQHPLASDKKIDENSLHSFGNLCLISRGANSKLSNHAPIDKAANCKQEERSGKIASLKQWKMADITINEGDWTAEEIQAHAQQMQEILLANP